MMTDSLQIPAEVIEAAVKAMGPTNAAALEQAPVLAKAAIRAADKARGLREERRLRHPTGVPAEGRLVSDWRPVEGEGDE